MKIPGCLRGRWGHVSLRDILRRIHERYLLDRAMRALRNAPDLARVDSRVLSEIVRGWGNIAWSAWEEYLQACLEQAAAQRGPILECGSGLTTLILGLAAERLGTTLWSLEDGADWAEATRRALARYRIASVRLCVNELRSYGEFSWYDPPLATMPKDFALVVADGPPGSTAGGRYGLLPVMRTHLRPGCVILLDDFARDEERAVARRWEEEFGVHCAPGGVAKPFVRITVPESAVCAGGAPAAQSAPPLES